MCIISQLGVGPPGDRDADRNLPVESLREAHGVTAPDLPASLRDQWSTEREAEGLIAMQENGVEPSVVQNLDGWYVQRGPLNLGRFGEADVAAFREYATKLGLAPEFIERLILWHGGAS